MLSRVLLYNGRIVASLIIKSVVVMYLHLEGIYARNQEMSDANGEVVIHADRIDSIELGGEEDLNDVSIDPLPRATRCLCRALHLSAGISNADAENPSAEGLIPSPREGSADVDMDCYEMALVSLAYVKLQQGDRASTREITSTVLRLGASKADGSGTNQLSQTQIMAQLYHRHAMISAKS